ncbi:hypothetical protein [Chryseobacterium taichungense]|uniref:hypothetical protein n=1 Tax=Chryseobacterium taichungense TaxID=295069 RepID=UPI000B7F4C6E|nr:hypothetical protein [Chryseobacterium taichungense]
MKLLIPVREALLPEPEFFISHCDERSEDAISKLHFPILMNLRSYFQLSALAIFHNFGSAAKPPNRNYGKMSSDKCSNLG